jgi:hypothetical protein
MWHGCLSSFDCVPAPIKLDNLIRIARNRLGIEGDKTGNQIGHAHTARSSAGLEQFGRLGGDLDDAKFAVHARILGAARRIVDNSEVAVFFTDI